MTQQQEDSASSQAEKFYKVQFRENEQVFSASSRILNLKAGEVAMVQTDHNLEPARVVGIAAQLNQDGTKIESSHILQRRGTRDEIDRYERLIEREQEAFAFCLRQIEKHQLSMKLIRVERFFNGSKIIATF